MKIAYTKSMVAFGVTALIITLLGALAIMPLKYAAAQGGALSNLGDVLPDRFKEKITAMKSNHPELASLGEKVQSMNITQGIAELEDMLDMAKEMTTGIKNLQGNMTAK
jgi:hypothetical protein